MRGGGAAVASTRRGAPAPPPYHPRPTSAPAFRVEVGGAGILRGHVLSVYVALTVPSPGAAHDKGHDTRGGVLAPRPSYRKVTIFSNLIFIDLNNDYLDPIFHMLETIYS